VAVSPSDKPLVWFHGEIKTPPFSRAAGVDWRIVHRLDPDTVVIVEVFSKKTQATPKTVIDACTRRLREYDRA
jgi:phage-related protein